MIGGRAVVVLTIAVSVFYINSSLKKNKVTGPTLEINSGKLKGVISRSRDGRNYFEYLGIPYAQPPVDDLRFESPQPAGKWDGVRDATEYGAKCIQLDLMENKILGEENCLFLNVFTPTLNLDGQSKLKPMPVLVFIHGGLFVFGSSNMYRPDYYMDEDVVLVTVNYRLAAFGFLNTGDGVVRGNMGLKDQTLALKWVQKNIQVFGGDPNRVTICGESAGAASVHFQMLSPMSKGLFHKAISQSGVALNPWAITKNPKEQAKRFGSMLNCPNKSSEEMVACLKSLTALELAEGHREVQNPLRETISVFVPTVELNSNEADTFLSEPPEVIMQSGRAHKVPWIVGANSEEGLINSAVIMRNQSLLSLTQTNWEGIVPRLLYLEDDEQVLKRIRDFYFEGAPRIDTIEDFKNFTNLFSDRFWHVGIHQTVKQQSQFSPVYFYHYTYPGEFSLVNYVMALKGEYSATFELLMHISFSWLNKNILGRSPPNYGVCHSDELGMQFYLPLMSRILTSDKDYLMSKALVKLWVSFVSSEEENIALTFMEKSWLPQEANATLKFMRLGVDPVMLDEPFSETVKFWDSLRLS